MRVHVSEWVDHPENVLKCNGYVVMIDSGDLITTLGPFGSTDEALDFIKKVGDSNYDVTVQPLCKLKDVRAEFLMLSERIGNVN